MAATVDLIAPGRRVVLRAVQRYPFAFVPAGTTGTIAHADSDVVNVRLDADHGPALLEWANGLEWYSRDGAGGYIADARLVLLQDLAAIA